MVKKIDKHGNLVDLTVAEEAQRQARETAYIAQQKVQEEEATQKAAKEASGKQKLKDLGLDDEEIKALTGK